MTVETVQSTDEAGGRSASDRMMTDERLMALVQGNDPHAFEVLYDRHSTQVFWLAMRILEDRGLAADAAQEAFIALWRSRSSYEPGRGRVKWWLQSIVRNRAIDLRRRDRDIVLRTDDGLELNPSDDCTEDEVIALSEQQELHALLDTLPSEQREVIELAYFAGLTHAEITQKLGIPLGTIKGRIRLALDKLRAALPDGQAPLLG
jgi:RNA polymerase sigma-70 factor, ECF subfamily